ncbi:FHA domain-containing protein [uncultured Arthrobacter sp.]|uniref:FHA domain-containing protein n=1 Tax=uncultured Arthrobacter sp. TaxID=114050 RepID=UPI00260FBAB3|nr:FHA domain-containing protein [uncultured Arthrobacter sp.]
MSQQVRLDIDLTFSRSQYDDDGTPQALNGTVSAAGSEVTIYFEDPAAAGGGGGFPSLDSVRQLAASLADQGLTVTLAGPNGRLVSIGKVETSMAQRLMTRSPHIRAGSIAALAPLIRGANWQAGSGTSLLPPSTPFPLVPTVNRRIRRQVTTTHHTPGSGRPRLIFVQNSETWNGQIPREVNLAREQLVIGSSPDADLVLEGLEPTHATVEHNADDEYVLVPHGPVRGSVQPDGPSILRTGARVQLGDWCLAYFREEYADHGRPFGGRSGGELAHQRPQYDPRTGAVEEDGSFGIGDNRQSPR